MKSMAKKFKEKLIREVRNVAESVEALANFIISKK